MNDRDTTVTKKETLAALRNPGELYVILSGATRMPFIVCDEETYDDQVLLYYRAEDAKEKVKELEAEDYPAAVVKIEQGQLLPFYTSLYFIGVNCLAVNWGTDTQISVQLDELVTRKKPSEESGEKKIIENPALHLTAAYFMQEARKRHPVKPTEEMKQLQEEMLAHYMKGTYFLVMQEDGQIPVLKQKDGSVYQPIFTDLAELQKFTKGKKMKTAVIPAAKIPEILAGKVKGVVINPMGVNVQLQVGKKKPETQS